MPFVSPEEKSRVADLFADTITASPLRVSDAWILSEPSAKEDSIKVAVQYTQTDLLASSRRTFLKYYTTGEGQTNTNDLVPLIPFPIELKDVVLLSPSPSGRLLAVVLRNTTSGSANSSSGSSGSSPTQRLEIWEDTRVKKSIDLSSHGNILKDGWFESFQWSRDEKFLLFIAEPKAKSVTDAKNFFDPSLKEDGDSKKKSKDGKSKKKDSLVGHAFDYREDWGEKYVGVCQPRPFLTHVESGKVSVVKGIPSSLSTGQAVFSPDGKEIVFTGWPNGTKRLGLIYCYQRKCGLYSLNIEKTVTELEKEKEKEKKEADSKEEDEEEDEEEEKDETVLLTGEDPTARCPRFSPDGSKLAFLASGPAKTHNTAFSLRLIDWKSSPRTQKTILPIPEDPTEAEFPGVFCTSLPTNVWTSDSSAVVFSSQWRSVETLIRVDIAKGTVERVLGEPKDNKIPSVGAFATRGDIVIAVESSPVSPWQVILVDLNNKRESVKKTAVAVSNKDLESHLKSLEWQILSIPSTVEPSKSFPTFECIYLAPPAPTPSGGGNGKLPVIIFPHGGPHSAFPTHYSPNMVYFTRLGFAVVLVNFRGSTGFGLPFLESLPGKIGILDIADTIDAVEYITGVKCESFSSTAKTHTKGERPSFPIDPERIFYYGGSHSGFMGGHLTGRYPKLFRASALRNAALDIAGMVGQTDIPDWCYVESGQDFDFENYKLPSKESLGAMYDRSATAYLSEVKTPTLLLVGVKDRRVPMSASIQWYHALKALNVPTRMILYPEDVHAIDSVKSEADANINTVLWFLQYDVEKKP